MQAPDWATHIVSGIGPRGEDYKVWVSKGKWEYFSGPYRHRDMNHPWGVEDWEEGIRDAGWKNCLVEEINICLENK